MKTARLTMTVVQDFDVPDEWSSEDLDARVKESTETYAGTPTVPFRFAGAGIARSWDVRAEWPNDPKLSDSPARRDPCVEGGKVEAGSTGHDAQASSLQRMVRRCGDLEKTSDDDAVWERLQKFTEVMRQVNDDTRKAMAAGQKVPREQTKESILLAVAGCRVIREACSQLHASASDQTNEHLPVLMQDSEVPVQGCVQPQQGTTQGA